MDTSIAFLLIAAVLFVVIVPTVLRRSAEKDEDAQPTRVRTVDVERTQRCAVDDSRPQLLRDEAHPARVDLPVPTVRVEPTAPRLSLRAPRPALAVVEGSGEAPAHQETPSTEVRDLPQALPLAVGAAPLLDLSSDHRAAAGAARLTALSTMDVRAAQTGPSASDPMDTTMTSSHRTPSRRVAAAAERMPRDLPADVRARLAQPAGPRSSGPSPSTGRPSAGRPQSSSGTASAGRSQTRAAAPTVETRRRIRRLRAVLPLCGLTVVAMALATLVCTGFVIFGSLPWGVPVVTLALGLAGLALVRGLISEIRALRSGTAAEAPSAQQPTRTSAAADRSARLVARTSAAAPRRTRLSADELQAADVDAEPITADLPIVRETASMDAESPEASVAVTTEDRTEEIEATAEADPTAEGRTTETEVAAASASGLRTRSVFAGSSQLTGSTVAETLARRRSPGEWTPSVLPVPRYVEAETAAPAPPAPVVADASSYSLSPADKESLAEQFAEELGYRPALADAAATAPRADEGPLGHGRTAIRGGGAQTADGTRVSGRAGAADSTAPAQLGDILARRRA